MKEAIIRYIDHQLAWARKYPDAAGTYCQQTFGAVEFFCENCATKAEYDEICALWEETREKFWEIQWEGQRNDEA